MRFIKQLGVILSISFIAEVMEYYIPLPVAASMYGLVIMLAGLLSGVITLNQVEDAADFLVEIMPVLFIPPTVGIITSVGEMKQMLVPLCVISVVSTLLVMVVTGRVSQWIIRKENRRTGVETVTGIEEKEGVKGTTVMKETTDAKGSTGMKGTTGVENRHRTDKGGEDYE